MANKKILAVACDRGGWNAIKPVLEQALVEGHDVAAHFVGTCADQFNSGSLVVDSRLIVETKQPAADFVLQPHDLLMVGSSQSPIGRHAAVAAIMANHRPILAVQDNYGSLLPTLQQISSDGLRIDKEGLIICVTDQGAAEHLLDVRYLRSGNIVVTGGPHFDSMVALQKNWSKRRRAIRTAIRATSATTVFLVVGQLSGTGEILGLIDQLPPSQKMIILREHPRATELEKWLTACCRLKPSIAQSLVEVHVPLVDAAEDILPGADFVLSGYSTTGYVGAFCQMTGVVCVGTPANAYELRREKALDRPPEVEMGAAWYVTNAQELAQVVTLVRQKMPSFPKQELQKVQRSLAKKHDGQATERVWQEAKKLLKI